MSKTKQTDTIMTAIVLVLSALFGVAYLAAKTQGPRAGGGAIAGSSDGDSSAEPFSLLPPDRVTKAEYLRIQDGMSYREVTGIIGSPGDELSSTTMDAIPGITPRIVTTMYSWANDDGSNMNAMFQNDKLISKAQFGLD